MPIDVYPPLTISEKGTRKHNEDFVTASSERSSRSGPLIYMVCDGVGGEARGEIASSMAAGIINRELTASKEPVEIHEAVTMAQNAITGYVKQHADARGMATTLTLLVLDGTSARIAHMGDSRVYQFRDGKLLRRTTDHSLVQELLNSKLITEEQAKDHPRRNVITRAIMQESTPSEPEVLHITDLIAEDMFLLCSDGVLESFSDDELVTLMGNQNLTDQQRIQQMEQHCAANSRDNYTACMIRLQTVTTYVPGAETNREGTQLRNTFKMLFAKIFG